MKYAFMMQKLEQYGFIDFHSDFRYAFFDLAETVREGLKKKVDVLNREQLNNNPDLMNEILKDGVKIYG